MVAPHVAGDLAVKTFGDVILRQDWVGPRTVNVTNVSNGVFEGNNLLWDWDEDEEIPTDNEIFEMSFKHLFDGPNAGGGEDGDESGDAVDAGDEDASKDGDSNLRVFKLPIPKVRLPKTVNLGLFHSSDEQGNGVNISFGKTGIDFFKGGIEVSRDPSRLFTIGGGFGNKSAALIIDPVFDDEDTEDDD